MNPVLHFGDQILLPSWIFILSLALSLSLLWLYFRAGRMKIPRPEAIDTALAMMVGAVMGGRLLHVLYEQPEYYMEHPFRILAIWEGGMVFYGALLGALLLGAIWARRGQASLFRMADLFAPIISFAYAIGRIGCFLNGCCYGRACDLPWAVRFHHHPLFGLEVIPRHPTQLYAVLWDLLVVLGILIFERHKRTPGFVFGLWMILHGLGRLVIEQFRADDRGPALLSLSISSWISVILLLGGALLIRRLTKVSPR